MTAKTLDGKALAGQIRGELAHETAAFTAQTGTTPCLAAILVGDDPASQVYVRNKEKACAQVGMASQFQRLPAGTSIDALLAVIDRLNRDASVHGILVQSPLPDGLDELRAFRAIDPAKDVDALHPENVGLLVHGRPRFLPCTPRGIQQLLIRSGIETAGAHVVVVGRSEIVGKPMAIMLMQRAAGANATVTVCHSRTRDLPEVCRSADILIVAIGQPRFIRAEMVRPGAVVIDVGVNRTEAGLMGDVDFESVKEVAAQITPVPGGIGPLTIAMLLCNTLDAARLQSDP